MLRYKTLEIDRLQAYFGEPFVIDTENTLGSITINQPTVGQLMKLGETNFFSSLNVFINNTTSYMVMLDEAGIDWNDISDFELFITLYRTLQKEPCEILFGDLDFQKFELMKKVVEDKEVIVLVNKEQNIEIDELVYQYIHQYLQYVFNIFPEERIIRNTMLKRTWLSKERQKIEIEKKKIEDGDKKTSSMQSVISACVNHPGFKYKLSEVKDMKICEFYDSVKRLQLYENATACLKGLFSGMVDGSKIDADSYNFMKDI